MASDGLRRVSDGGSISRQTFNDNVTAAELATVNQHGLGILSGLAITAGTGLTLNVADGIGQGAQAATIPAFSGTCPDNVTRYVWISFTKTGQDVDEFPVFAGSLTFTSTLVQPGGNLFCLGKVTTLSGAITTVTPDGRMVLDRWTALQTYSIGDTVTVDAASGNVATLGAFLTSDGFGYSTFSVASGNVTLDATQSQSTCLKTTGTPGVSRNVIGPLTAGKVFAVVNGSDAAIVVKGASGTGVTIATGKAALVLCDGTNYVRLTADAS